MLELPWLCTKGRR